MIFFIISLLGVLVVVLGFTTFNLLKKLEKQEDILLGYFEYLNSISNTIFLTDKKLKELDHKGSFKSDDEVGFFFEKVKEIQDILNSFKIKNIE